MYQSHSLPTATSIRLLDLIENDNGVIRCSMRVVDLDDDELDFAAISYTWGDPITVHEERMPDLTDLTLEEHSEQLPFAHHISLGPDGENLLMVDRAKLHYYDKYPWIPREELRWKSRTLREIEVDGIRVPVEQNLFSCFEALLGIRETVSKASHDDQLRDSACSTMRLPVWADALCINQADLAERAAQVQLMGRLYKSARLVFAWVGQMDQLAELALSAVHKILDFDATRLHAQDSSYPEQQEVTFSSVPGMTAVHWFALFAFFQRLWFRRAWIAQEAVFAKETLMVCGSSMYGMSLVLAVVAFLDDTGLDVELRQLGRNFLTKRAVCDQTRHWGKLVSFSQSPQRSVARELQVEPRDALSFILGCHYIRARLGFCNAGMPMVSLHEGREKGDEFTSSSRWEVELPECINLDDNDVIDVFSEELGINGIRFERRKVRLLHVLSHFRDLEATDPRDKIFAFQNLAEDELGLIPDYNADAKDVFVQAATSMICKRRGSQLAVLSHVQDPSDTRIKGLPSWVPDFSARLGHIPFDQGGYDDRFRAGTDMDMDMEFEDLSVSVNSNDNTLGVRAIRVGKVDVSTQLGDDPVVEALRLALRGPAEYPIKPRAWCYNDRRHVRAPRAVTRVEALWRTLVTDNLTEMDNDYGSLDSRDNLGEGFSNWILTDILEARDLFAEWAYKVDRDNWVNVLIEESFCTRMALWSALYDGKQVTDELEVPDIERMLDDQNAKMKSEGHEEEEKKEQEEEAASGSDERLEEQPDGASDANDNPKQVGFLPSARHIRESFAAPPAEEAQRDEDPLGGKYKRPSMQRLTPLERRKLRNFEKHMRRATEGRKLFMTTCGLFGLGPKSLGQNPDVEDEVWILMGARVPFILRHVEGRRYQVVGEAYVHGIMYGEGYDHFTYWETVEDEDWTDEIQMGVEDIYLV